METLLEILSASAEQNANRLAVVESEAGVDYRSLQKNMVSLAARLHRAGVRHGDRVALLFPNSLEFVTTFLAIVHLGAIAVPLNHQCQRVDIIHILRACGVSLLVTSREFASLCREALREQGQDGSLFLLKGRQAFSAAETIPNGDFENRCDADLPATYLLSSGSTGTPKRVGRTHAALAFELRSLVKTLHITSEDRFLGVAPFSHVNGLTRSMILSLAAGATLYPLPKFDRQLVTETIEDERISVFIGVPFMFGILAKTNFQRQPDFSSLRLCLSASAPMSPALNRQFHDRFGIYVRQLYGSTETGTISVDLSTDIEASLESVGKPIAGIEVEILNEAGHPAQANEMGEVAVKSPAAIKSYDCCEEPDRQAFKNDFFLTGDLGRRDKNGVLYLAGRKKLFINRGGYKVNPKEIEDWLKTHPKIDEAVVLGLPTSYGDEKIKAIIVLNDSCNEEDIITHCRGKIADFKIPSLIEFRKELPMTPTGKIQREILVRV